MTSPSHYAANPESFWRWCWPRELTQEERDLLLALKSNYRRWSYRDIAPEGRERIFAEAMIWKLLTNTKSAVIWPLIGTANDVIFYDTIKKAANDSQQSFVRSTFSFVDRRLAIGRHFPASVLSGFPLAESELATMQNTFEGPIMALIPHFDSTPTSLIRLFCSKLQGPNVQMVVGSNQTS